MNDTGAAKLPGIQPLRTTDRALAAWSQAVTEHLEVRNGSRGNPMEKVVLERDITSINKVVEGLTKPKTASSTDVTVDIGGGVTAVIPVDLLVDRLLANKKFQQAAGITAPTTQEDTIDYNGAAISRVEANLGARIDALKSNKSLADQAFYISRPTDTQMATFFVTGTPSFGGGPDPASKLPPARHPNAVALKPDVVIYNDFTIDELMRDLYWMLYDGGGKDGKPVKLSPASVIYNGQTIQDWAAYMYVTRVLAERACVAAGVSPVA